VTDRRRVAALAVLCGLAASPLRAQTPDQMAADSQRNAADTVNLSARYLEGQALAKIRLPVAPRLDADGVMRESACIGRIADGIAHFFTKLQGGGRPEGIGGAALEYRFVFHSWPRLSDVIEVRSALSALNNKAMQVTHYMFDVASSECFASSQAVVVWFDLVARKAIAFPDDVRPFQKERVIEGLVI